VASARERDVRSYILHREVCGNAICTLIATFFCCNGKIGRHVLIVKISPKTFHSIAPMISPSKEQFFTESYGLIEN
jgi:hypothetical protein